MYASVCVCFVLWHVSSVSISLGNLPIFYILTGETQSFTLQFTLCSLHTDAIQSPNGRNGRRRKNVTFSVTCLEALWVLSHVGPVVTQGSRREKGAE